MLLALCFTERAAWIIRTIPFKDNLRPEYCLFLYKNVIAKWNSNNEGKMYERNIKKKNTKKKNTWREKKKR